MKNSVLMIAYSFPPEGSAGVYRPLRFVRHLPKLGWSVTVIAADPEHDARYDSQLLALVPPETEVVRVRRRDLWLALQAKRGQRTQAKMTKASIETITRTHAAHRVPLRSFLREMVHTVEAWYYFPDRARGWVRPALKATVAGCARKRPQVIWATGGPWSSFVVAQRASQRTGVPYVLDFRDSWTLAPNELESRRPAWGTQRERRALYCLLKGAQAVVFRYETEAECYWRAYPGALDTARIHIIPNGYDGSIDTFAVAPWEKCTILYAGTIGPYRYDTLLQALYVLKQTFPDKAKCLRFLFIGEGREALAEEATALGLSDVVKTIGAVPYTELARFQQEAHASLVLGVKPMKGSEFCGSKIFDYFRAGRPILGVLPVVDEAHKILCRVGVSTVADIDSVQDIMAAILRIYDAWSAGTLSSLVPNPTACDAYSAERQTAALVRALEGSLAAEPFVPGVVGIPPSLRGEIGTEGWVNGKR